MGLGTGGVCGEPGSEARGAMHRGKKHVRLLFILHETELLCATSRRLPFHPYTVRHPPDRSGCREYQVLIESWMCCIINTIHSRPSNTFTVVHSQPERITRNMTLKIWCGSRFIIITHSNRTPHLDCGYFSVETKSSNAHHDTKHKNYNLYRKKRQLISVILIGQD